MTNKGKYIKEKIDKTYISNETLNQIIKDRIDFGFDSIYFRYAEVIEELSWFKLAEAKRERKSFDRKEFCNTRKMHFYNCLEQLLQAHRREE